MKALALVSVVLLSVCIVRGADKFPPCAALKAFQFEAVDLARFEKRICDGPSRLASEGIEAVGYYENRALRYFTASLIGAAGFGDLQMKVDQSGVLLVHYVEREFEREESPSASPRKEVRFSFIVSSGHVVWCDEDRREEVLAKALSQEITRLVVVLNTQKKAPGL